MNFPVFADGSDSPLLSLIPQIGRARGFRLYTLDGRRLVDLWQYGGRAILGHTPARLLLSFKNSASRGLFAPFPHPQQLRLEKALASIFPSRAARVYRSDASLGKALAANGGVAALWRPFLDSTAPLVLPDAPVIVPVLPLPWMNAPAFLILKHDAAPAFPPSDIISPVWLSAATRAVYDLIHEAQNRVELPFNKIDRRLSNTPWKRRGIYLSHTGKPAPESYSAMFSGFLEGGFLLPPDSGLPAILPPSLSKGEMAKLFSLFESFK